MEKFLSDSKLAHFWVAFYMNPADPQVVEPVEAFYLATSCFYEKNWILLVIFIRMPAGPQALLNTARRPRGVGQTLADGTGLTQAGTLANNGSRFTSLLSRPYRPPRSRHGRDTLEPRTYRSAQGTPAGLRSRRCRSARGCPRPGASGTPAWSG